MITRHEKTIKSLEEKLAEKDDEIKHTYNKLHEV